LFIHVSWSRFFRNQDRLSETRVHKDLGEALQGADAVILAVRHEAYLALEPEDVVKLAGRTVAVIDCFGMLNDANIQRYFELGCEVKGLGRGHIKRIKDRVKLR
jgi:UDP-N-acetyl-D-mannosaminuronate dehydrogenase